MASEVVITLPDFSLITHENAREMRREYVRDYSWAIPSTEALLKVNEFSPIIEIGAGGGYWAHLLSKTGANVIAFDDETEKYQRKWFEVRKGGPEKISDFSDHTLFLCWPPYNSPMANECLAKYTGEYFLYIGEPEGMACADDLFFERVKRDFRVMEEMEIPRWEGKEDRLVVYRRKS